MVIHGNDGVVMRLYNHRNPTFERVNGVLARENVYFSDLHISRRLKAKMDM